MSAFLLSDSLLRVGLLSSPEMEAVIAGAPAARCRLAVNRQEVVSRIR